MTTPPFLPVNWALIRDTLWQWFSEVSGCETIWADQNEPQPAYPFASLNILPGTIALGALDEQRIAADGSLQIVGQRDFVLSCQIHSGTPAHDPNCDAISRAHSVIASLAVPQYAPAFRTANLGLRERGQVQMLDLVVGAEWIRRAQVDIRFGTMSFVEISAWPDLSETGWFEKVVFSGDIQGLRSGSTLNPTDELIDPT